MSEEATQAEKVEQVDVAEQEGVEQTGGRNSRKALTGVVVSDKMDKTIVVMVEDRVKHPLYGKVMTKSSRLLAHDEENDAGIGDRVRVMETRPLSARKRWRLVSVIERAK